MNLRFSVLASVLACAAPAFANDTMAELKTGGLAWVTSDDVMMEEEALFISMEEVRVDYVFRNTSDHDIEAVVAFPMPALTGEPEVNIQIENPEADNFLGFTVTQDGKTITPALDQRIKALGVDRTDEVRKAGIPLLPFSEKTVAALKALPEETRADLMSKGMLYKDVYDAGQGEVTDYRPLWTLESAYWWKTVFPKGQPVRVSHRYKPSVGGTVDLTFVDDTGAPGPSYKDYASRFCLDSAFMRTAAKLRASALKGDGPIFTESWVSYILSTGANWNGPIGRFSLTIDKGRPENYVSFCGESVKKIAPTTFRMEKTDFWPERELDILFLVANAAE